MNFLGKIEPNCTSLASARARRLDVVENDNVAARRKANDAEGQPVDGGGDELLEHGGGVRGVERRRHQGTSGGATSRRSAKRTMA